VTLKNTSHTTVTSNDKSNVEAQSETHIKDSIQVMLARIERAMHEPLQLEQLRDVLKSLAPTTQLLDEIEFASRSSTPIASMEGAADVADVEMHNDADAADMEMRNDTTFDADAEQEATDLGELGPACTKAAQSTPGSPSASSDEEEAIPIVERVSTDVQTIERELIALETLATEFECNEADEKTVGKAIYRAKAASNDLMNRMLELDGVKLNSAENRPRRKAVVSSIHALLDRADAALEKLKLVQVSAAAATSAAADSQRVTDQDWVGCMHHSLRQQCRLQAHIQRDEYEGCYALFIQGAEVQPDDIDISISADERYLELSMCRLPTSEELLAMRRTLTDRAVPAATVETQLLRQLNGTYGTYTAKFGLPWDADASAIRKQAGNGTVTVLLPKSCSGFARAPTTARAMHSRPHSAQPPRRPHSARGHNHMYDPFRGFLGRDGLFY
jgi:hypothetical protein